MDAMLTKKADELARELAGQAETLNDLNETMRSQILPNLNRLIASQALEPQGQTLSQGTPRMWSCPC